MKDMLSFKILNEEGQPMISVACVSGQGGSLLLHDKFDDFKDEHEYSAHNIKFLLEISKKAQIIVTTHSSLLIKQLQLKL